MIDIIIVVAVVVIAINYKFKILGWFMNKLGMGE